jgi:hypothetical protein
MLLAMFISWEVQGHPHYPSMDDGQNIAYISDIGAQGLKPLFVAGSVITTVFLDLAFLADRWLRHKGLLAKNITVAEKVLSAFAIVFAIVGTAGLILLSIFDTLRHPRLHDIFLLLFIAGYVISAIFTCAEFQRLGIHFREHRILRMSFWIKLVFILLEIALAIVFAVCTFRGNKNVGAIIEWVIALVFTFWVLSFFVDLLPAVRTRHHNGTSDAPQLEMGGVGGPHIVNGDNSQYANDNLDSRYANGNGSALSLNGNGYNGRAHGHALSGHTLDGQGDNGYVVNNVKYQEPPRDVNF